MPDPVKTTDDEVWMVTPLGLLSAELGEEEGARVWHVLERDLHHQAAKLRELHPGRYSADSLPAVVPSGRGGRIIMVQKRIG